MKLRTLILGLIISILALSAGYQYTNAATGNDPVVVKVGTVRIRKVLRDCQKNASYRAQFLAEQKKFQDEVRTLQSQADQIEAGLSALKPGTAEYLKNMKKLMSLQSEIELKKQYNNQERLAKDHRWTEDLYQQILEIVDEIATERGLDLVLEANKPEFPLPSSEELMMALRTHTVLYDAGAVDLTADTIKRLDAK